MTDPIVLLQQFRLRYRTALLTKIGLLGVLGLGILGAAAWRFHTSHLQSVWGMRLVGAASVVGLISLLWWVHRRWVSPEATAAYLDQMLHLEQRLLTAAEFARQKHPPALYPLLVDDIAHRYATHQAQFPRPLDRTTGALAMMLLLLLFWPGEHAPLRLAQAPAIFHPPQPPQPQTPPPPEQHQHDESQRSSTQQASAASQQGQSQQASGSEGSGKHSEAGGQSNTPQQGVTGSQENPQGTSSTNATRGAEPPSQDQPSGKQQATAAQQPAENAQRRGEGAQPAGDHKGSTADQRQATSDKEHGSARERSGQTPNNKQARGGNTQQSGTGKERESAQQQQAKSGTSSSSGERPGSKPSSVQQQSQGQQVREGRSVQLGAQQQASPGGSGTPPIGNQDALKAQIQELLKEVSGELKQLQAQLSSANDLPKPQAGTSTDPGLYESPMPMDQAKGGSLPIQLQTDAAPTKNQRPAGGVGQSSGDVAHAAVRTSIEEAQLSDEPREETPTARQPVPPEYRSVFEQLRKRGPQQSETKP